MAGIKQLGHVGIHCTDLQRSLDFYTRVLGLKVTDAASDVLHSRDRGTLT
ncbi:MAG: VOC family protein, partial [Dehalococcoidia bacterium]